MGKIGDKFRLVFGSEANITGGSVGNGVSVLSSEMNISGGTIGAGLRGNDSSDIQLIGGDFELNGEPFSGSTISLNELDVFTGTLADGSPFIFSQIGLLPRSDRFTGAKLTLVELPPLDLSPMVVSTSSPSRPSGLRSGQTLTLRDGGQLANSFEAINATLNVEGGILGDSAGAFNSVVNITGGVVGAGFNAYPGSAVSISGGEVGRDFYAFPGSEVNISDGSVGTFFAAYDSVVNITGGTVDQLSDALSGSVFNISGGAVSYHFDAWDGSVVNVTGGRIDHSFDVFSNAEVNISSGSIGSDFHIFGGVVNISGGSIGSSSAAFDEAVVNISGGSIGDRFEARRGSDVELIGGEFKLNGDVFLGDTISLDGNDVFSGTLADGSTFVFSELSEDELSNVTLTLAALPTLNLAPVTVSTAFPTIPSGLREGQTLILAEGGELGCDFEAVDAT